MTDTVESVFCFEPNNITVESDHWVIFKHEVHALNDHFIFVSALP